MVKDPLKHLYQLDTAILKKKKRTDLLYCLCC